jgi:hypothetical protein
MCAEPTDSSHPVDAAPTDEFSAPPVPRPHDTVEATRPAARDGTRPSQLALIFLAVGAACFLVGIAVASVTRPSAVDPVLQSQDVGPSGGTVRFEGGELRVPEGALSQAITVVVRRSVVDRRVRIDPGGGEETLVFEPGRLVAYGFEPAGVTFAKSVTITFRLPAGALNGTAFARRADTGSIVLLRGTVDGDRGTATTKVRDFGFRGTS